MKPRRSIHPFHCRLSSLAIALIAFAVALTVVSPAFGAPLVVIDPGHGGIYNNARYGSFLEKQANLLLSLELSRQLYAAGFDVRFTRTTDTAITYSDLYTWHWVSEQDRWVYAPDGMSWYPDGVPRDDLQARCDVANNLGADIFISVHCNGAASAAANGTENWASTHDVLGQQLGDYVQAGVLEQTHQRDRGSGATDFYVVRWANMPSLLLESGFMSNPTEGAWLTSASWRAAYCRGVVNGISRWYATNPLRPIHSRYAGATHSETAVLASQTQWPAGADTVVLAHTLDTASAYAAPLATAKLGAPLLFADMRELTAASAAEITRLGPSRIIAFGNEIPDSVLLEAAAAAGIDPSAVTRVAGAQPTSAAAMLSAELYSADTSCGVVFASGANQNDALAAAQLAAARGEALLLANADGSLPPEAASFLAARSGKITRVTRVGVVADGAIAGLPNRQQIGDWEPNQIFGAAMLAARPWGNTWLYCFDPNTPTDALIAACAAANRTGGMTVPIPGDYMAPFTREWLENSGHRVAGTTMVGSTAVLPVSAEHYVQKAIY